VRFFQAAHGRAGFLIQQAGAAAEHALKSADFGQCARALEDPAQHHRFGAYLALELARLHRHSTQMRAAHLTPASSAMQPMTITAMAALDMVVFPFSEGQCWSINIVPVTPEKSRSSLREEGCRLAAARANREASRRVALVIKVEVKGRRYLTANSLPARDRPIGRHRAARCAKSQRA
jgi:hypothetical protein